MKYADSFRDQEVITVTGQTTYSKWYDVSWANELYCFLTNVETGTPNSETVDVTIERASGFETDVPVTVVTFTQITGATTEEKYAGHMFDNAAPGAENKLGMRIRFKYVSGGTFGAGATETVTVTVHAKRN
jgi:hypothetical protein